MSTFGDRTPAEEMLEWIQVVQRDCGLTDDEVVTVLLVITQVYQEKEPFEVIQRKLKPYD